ncbi:MAG: hypothetical protein DCF22_22325 [Leptolyngbya sp.]|nr:MAG: hypothetical protein DCF22_22325 [Leptolyngbya sp.]
MAVIRKPKVKSVDDFIQEGGTASQVGTTKPAIKEASEGEVKGLKLRLPVDLLKRVDDAVATRRPAPSRHQWILEALYEKLDRELEEAE